MQFTNHNYTMSENQLIREEEENEGDEKECINDGIDSSHDSINDEEIDDNNDDFVDVETIEDNQPVESHNSNVNNNNSNNNDDDGNIYDNDDDNDNNDTNDVNDIDDDDDSSYEISKDECPLQYAISSDKSIQIILQIIDLFPMDVQHKNKKGDYPLHIALICGNKWIALMLIVLFPEAVQHQNMDGFYPLHLAIRSHNSKYELSEVLVIKLIEIFLEAAIESTKEGTALHFACNKILSETVYIQLIEINPRAIYEKDNRGSYPIHFAIERDLPIAVIKLLLDDDPLGMRQRNVSNETLIYVACETNNADFDRHLMQQSDLQINRRDCYGNTPLHHACHHGRIKIVDILLNHPDIDVNATDSNNDTPLHVALKFHVEPEARLKIVQKLLDHSYISINQKNIHDKTPLDVAKGNLIEVEEYSNNVTSLEEIIQFFREVINLLEEFPIKKRWKLYCYYIKN